MIFHPEYFVALAIGFFGSLHCFGMCGPIALVTPSPFPGTAGRMIGGLIYNSGRIITYIILGLIAGSIGRSIHIFNWQQGLSITLGLVILLNLFLPRLFTSIGKGMIYLKFTNAVKNRLSKFLGKSSIPGIFSIGLINGLLPCGLVYLGLAGGIEIGSAIGGGVFMAMFGLGTLPMMTGLHLMGFNLKNSSKKRLNRFIPVFVFIMGILFLLRGLSLGIPYVSPSFDPHGDIECVSPEYNH